MEIEYRNRIVKLKIIICKGQLYIFISGEHLGVRKNVSKKIVWYFI